MNAGGLSILLVWLLLFGAAAQLMRLASQWRRGAAAPVNWFTGLASVPRRYLVDVHAIVERRPGAASMHQAIAGGLLAGSFLILLGIVPFLRTALFYWVLVALAFAVTLVGAAMVARRRLPIRPKSLSAGKFTTLPLYLAAYAVGALIASIGVLTNSNLLGAIGVVIAAFGGAMLIASLWNGPMRHAMAGALHLAAHPRPARFAGNPANGLNPPETNPFGVASIEDFAWNRLLGFDACIQCGRCEEACPAFAAGQPLNPKALIQDFCVSLRPNDAPAYAGSPHPGIATPGPILGRIHPETLWSCTTCRACVASCPMMIEHVDAIIDLRRNLTLAHGAAPGKADRVLAELRYADNPGGFAAARRLDFAAGLKLRVLAPGETTDILLWLGDGAFDRRYGQTLRAVIAIMQAAKLDFAVLGAAERDCGDVARRLGDEASFARLATANIATMQSRHFTRIVTPDPHALHVLRHEYRYFGGDYTVVHHTSLIDDLITNNRITLGAINDVSITYHDPCYLGRYNNEIAAPRRILARLTGNNVEMSRHGMASFCCGGGGAAPITDIPGKHRIPNLRIAQARETGAAIVAVACPGCTAMLEGVVEPRPAVRDIAELVRDALVTSAAVPA